METLIEKAKRIRALMEKISALADDETILEAPEVCPYWKACEAVVPGDRRFYAGDGKLYKVREGQGHTTQADWTPDQTPVMWVVVAPASEDGSLEHPITASRGMEYTYGLYYLDPEDEKIYLCARAGEENGTVVVLHYMPHELVGMYFTLVE